MNNGPGGGMGRGGRGGMGGGRGSFRGGRGGGPSGGGGGQSRTFSYMGTGGGGGGGPRNYNPHHAPPQHHPPPHSSSTGGVHMGGPGAGFKWRRRLLPQLPSAAVPRRALWLAALRKHGIVFLLY